MSLLSRLRRSQQLPLPACRCPRCGNPLVPFWAEDDLAADIGAVGHARPGDHLVLRVKCDECGFAGRANTPRVLEAG